MIHWQEKKFFGDQIIICVNVRKGTVNVVADDLFVNSRIFRSIDRTYFFEALVSHSKLNGLHFNL